MKTLLISQRIDIYQERQERRDALDQKYVQYFKELGFMSLAVPNTAEIVPNILEKYKPEALVLSGGNDLVKLGGHTPERDKTEELLLNYALRKKIPLLGICRGAQYIASHIAEAEFVKDDAHAGKRHIVSGQIEREVNSFHNFKITALKNQEFDILARAKDNSIEAFRHRSYPILGLMWHPEREEVPDEYDVILIKEFLDTKKVSL